MGAEEKFVPGRLVCSTAGRDTGKFYLVYQVIGPTMVQVVNGAERNVRAPKKKNVKHLRPYPQLAPEILEKKNSGRRITDLEVRNALQRLLLEVQGSD
ncbi:MAG: KOW domain-containing RNA-binding protein [Desulfotomaculales bacterium]